MSELAHTVFLFVFWVSLAVIFALLFLRRNRPYVAVEGKGINVSAFTPTDILCIFLLICYYFMMLANYSPQPKATSLQFPSLARLISAQIFGCLPAIAIYLRLSKPKLKSILGLTRRPTLNELIIPIVIILCFPLVFNLDEVFKIKEFKLFSKWLCELLQTEAQVQTTVLYLQKGPLGLKIALGLIAIVVAPLLEELVFRGGIYTVLKKYAGMIPSLLFTSIFFALIHNSVFAFFPLMILSMILIWVYEKTKTLWTPILMHMLFNAITVVSAFFKQAPAP